MVVNVEEYELSAGQMKVCVFGRHLRSTVFKKRLGEDAEIVHLVLH